MKQSTRKAICAALGMELPASLILAVYEEAGLDDAEPEEILSDAHAGYLIVATAEDYKTASNNPANVKSRFVLWYYDGAHEAVKEIKDGSWIDSTK